MRPWIGHAPCIFIREQANQGCAGNERYNAMEDGSFMRIARIAANRAAIYSLSGRIKLLRTLSCSRRPLAVSIMLLSKDRTDMTKISSTGTDIHVSPAPRRLMIAVVCILCLGLLGSALFTFTTLSRMRAQYLSSRGHEIAAALEAQARGPGRRNNPAFWQSIFEENYEAYSGTVAFLALVGPNGNLLASKGDSSRRIAGINSSR